MGYTVETEVELEAEIQDGLSKWKRFPDSKTEYGTQYEVRMLIHGINNKYATVKTGWQIDTEKTNLRLTSVYVYKEK